MGQRVWPVLKRGVQLPMFSADLQCNLFASSSNGAFTYSRNTTATVWGYGPAAVIADGPTLLTAAINEARFTGARRISEGVWSAYDANGVLLSTTNGASALYGDALGPFGYTAEGQRTNLSLSSNNLDANGSYWDWNARISTTGSAGVAPDGTNTATLLTVTITDAGGASIISHAQISVTSGQTYTKSAYLKAGTQSWVLLSVLDNVGGTKKASRYFHLSGAGTVGSANDSTWTSSGTIQALAGGWYRLTLTTTVDTTVVIEIISDATADGNGACTAGDTFYGWGSQFELGTFASTLIPATSAAVTRNGDLLQYPLAGNWDNTQGSLYFEHMSEDTAPASVRLISSSGNGSNGAFLTATPAFVMYDATNTVTKNISPVNVLNKYAGSFSGSVLTVYANGVAGTPGTFDGDMGLSGALEIGSSANGGSPSFGTIRRVRTWMTVLSAADFARV